MREHHRRRRRAATRWTTVLATTHFANHLVSRLSSWSCERAHHSPLGDEDPVHRLSFKCLIDALVRCVSSSFHPNPASYNPPYSSRLADQSSANHEPINRRQIGILKKQ